MLVKVFAMSRLDFGQGVGKGDSYRPSALIPTCDAPDSIIHANVNDQDQGLTGRNHNTTLDTNQIKQALYYKPGASRARVHKIEYKRVSGSNNI